MGCRRRVWTAWLKPRRLEFGEPAIFLSGLLLFEFEFESEAWTVYSIDKSGDGGESVRGWTGVR